MRTEGVCHLSVLYFGTNVLLSPTYKHCIGSWLALKALNVKRTGFINCSKHMVRLPYPSHISPPKDFTANLNFISGPILSLLKSCSSIKQFFQIHTQILTSGLHTDNHLIEEIIHFCTFHRFGSLCYARIVIENSTNATPSSWNNVIRGYATVKSDNCDLPRESLLVFIGMLRSESRPDNFTYPFLFKACAAISALEQGRQINADVTKRGLDSDVYVHNSLIHFYGSCKKIVDACRVFDGMSYRTVVSWNSILSAFVDNLWVYVSVEYFIKMIVDGFEPDKTTLVILLSACSELGNLTLGKWVHLQTVTKGIKINCQLGTALIEMYAKCGEVNYASLVFDMMLDRNVWTWSAMILGLAQHGFATKAIELFMKMKQSPVRPNHVTFLGVLFACSHAGLVEDGYRFFHDMRHLHGIKPMIVHYGAMVDVLGRAGRLKEAYNFITSMPIRPDATVWRTLLSACNIHSFNDYDGVGEEVRKTLIKLEPRRRGNLVIFANKYAEVGMWDKAAVVRRSMRGLKKVAGESCIEVGGCNFRFFSGNDPHNACEIVFLLLDGLHMHMALIKYA